MTLSTIRRRLIVAALACWPAAHALAQDAEAPRPRHKVSAAELHAALAKRFPVRAGARGLLEIEVDAPRLLLLPARQQLGATLQIQLESTQSRRVESGEVDVVFTLRYERADRTLRANQLRVLDLRWPGLPPRTAQIVQSALPQLARDAVGEFVLHRFTERDLALAETMGFEPRDIVVADDGLVIEFGRRLG
jgi:hypothetical protein